jgi:hypothetical protein
MENTESYQLGYASGLWASRIDPGMDLIETKFIATAYWCKSRRFVVTDREQFESGFCKAYADVTANVGQLFGGVIVVQILEGDRDSEHTAEK